MKTPSEFRYLVLITIIFIAACIETDIYLPAFPDMMEAFSASEGEIQSLLTWNFLGICLSGPLYGPLSDAFGRKKPLMVALCLFLFGSIITTFAQNLDQMLWGRIFQGLGSGGCFTLGNAILFDAFSKEKAIRANNSLSTIIPLIMAIAPMLGAFLNHQFGFRANFLTITLFVLVSFIISLFFFKETHPTSNRIPFKIKRVAKDFKEGLTCLPFWQTALINSLIFAGYIAFLSGTSVLFVVDFQMSKTLFPFVQVLLLGGWVAGSLLLNKVIAKWGHVKVKKRGTFIGLTGAFAFIFFALCFPKDPYLITIAMTLFAFGANWMIGLYFPEGMEILSHIKGIASSMLTSIRLAIAAIAVGLASALYDGTIYPLAGLMVLILAILLPTIIFYEKRRKEQKLPHLAILEPQEKL